VDRRTNAGFELVTEIQITGNLRPPENVDWQRVALAFFDPIPNQPVPGRDEPSS
jgi:hypothetical protein